MNALLAFYYGSHADHQGRRLAEILRQDDAWMEMTHDYVQWLFPLSEPSRVHPGAPLVDARTAETFRSDELLQDHLRAALTRMLAFLGLRFERGEIVKAGNWTTRKGEWFAQPSHNLMRITRVLKSLRLLGLESEARSLYATLLRLYEHEPDALPDPVALRHWREAMK